MVVFVVCVSSAGLLLGCVCFSGRLGETNCLSAFLLNLAVTPFFFYPRVHYSRSLTGRGDVCLLMTECTLCFSPVGGEGWWEIKRCALFVCLWRSIFSVARVQGVGEGFLLIPPVEIQSSYFHFCFYFKTLQVLLFWKVTLFVGFFLRVGGSAL